MLNRSNFSPISPTSPSTCAMDFEALIAFGDGELSLWRAYFVRRHVHKCAACREEIRIMNQITHELQAQDARQDAMPPQLRERILADLNLAQAPEPATAPATEPPQVLEADAPSRKKWKSPSNPKVRWLQWSAAACACALVMSVAASMNGGADEMADFASSPSTSAARQSQRVGDASAPIAGAPIAGAASSSAAPAAPIAAPIAGLRGEADDFGKNRVITYDRAKRAVGEGQWSVRAVVPRSGAALDSTSIRSRSMYAPPSTSGASSSASSTSTALNLPSTLRRVHKEARIAVGVSSPEESAEAVESLVKSTGGFVASNTLTTGGNGLKSASLSIRVPVRAFENVMSQVAKLGVVQSKNVAGEDITERFSDAEAARQVLSSELGVKESLLRAALEREDASRKQKRDDFAVPWQQRAEVRRLRIEAAQARARMELLRKVSDLSNIEVELNEKKAAPGQAGFAEEMKRTSGLAFSSFAIAIRLPLNALIWVLAYAPLWLPLLLVYRVALKKLEKA